MERRRGVSFEDAFAIVTGSVAPLASESIAVTRAHGRALAHAVRSRVSLPRWDNAGMDGFGVKRADVAHASADQPVMLRVSGEVAAGADPAALDSLVSGSAVRIMTGAPVPAGVEAVIRVEDTEAAGDHVYIRSARDLGGRANIRPHGEEIREGDIVFDSGTSLGATHIGVLASTGAAEIMVHRRPRVALVSGGDELALLESFDEVLAGRRIVSSTSYSLPLLFGEAGADVDTSPIVADTLDATTAALEHAIQSAPDLIVTTGGISVGEHDYTRRALAALGASIEFWRARIRPGGPVGFGHIRGVPWLGLPGNPVSSLVTATLFAVPLLRRFAGHAAWAPQWFRARMHDTANTPGELTHFLRVAVTIGDDGVIEARSSGAQGSNLLRVMAEASGLLRVPEHVDCVAPGAMCDILLLPNAGWTTPPCSGATAT